MCDSSLLRGCFCSTPRGRSTCSTGYRIGPYGVVVLVHFWVEAGVALMPMSNVSLLRTALFPSGQWPSTAWVTTTFQILPLTRNSKPPNPRQSCLLLWKKKKKARFASPPNHYMEPSHLGEISDGREVDEWKHGGIKIRRSFQYKVMTTIQHPEWE